MLLLQQLSHCHHTSHASEHSRRHGPKYQLCWGEPKASRKWLAMAAPTSWAQIDEGCLGRPSSTDNYGFPFLQALEVPPGSQDRVPRVLMETKSRRPQGGDCMEPIWEHLRRPGAEGPRKATERRLAWDWLHVAAADWHVPEVVMLCNSLDYLIDCILYSWGRWLRALKTL
jgi:hypothetical protein